MLSLCYVASLCCAPLSCGLQVAAVVVMLLATFWVASSEEEEEEGTAEAEAEVRRCGFCSALACSIFKHLIIGY